MRLTRRGFLTGLSGAALATMFPRSAWHGLFGIPPAVAQSLPAFSADFGKGRKVAVIGAGIAGLTSAYELLRAGFDVTVFEGQKRCGGRSLTVRPSDPDYRDWYLANNRFVSRDSYCDFIPAEVRGAMVPEQRSNFTPVRAGDDYVELYFNSGPGRIPTHHTGVLHYCREFGVELQPYILVSETNLLQADDFNGGDPVQIRQFRYDLRGYLAQSLDEATDVESLATAEMPASLRDQMRRLAIQFGGLQPSGRFTNTDRAGYAIVPGAGINSGILRTPIPLDDLLNADELWHGLFAGARYDWQSPLLEPVGGMDMIWQALLKQRIAGSELREHVRLEHTAAGLRYADDARSRVSVLFKDDQRQSPETFDYVIMTGKAVELLEMDTAGVVGDDVRSSAETVLYERAGKYGWQARTRFWEAPDVGIVGGISWTDHQIEQMWYPSYGYNSPTGVLTGAYTIDENPVDRNGKFYPAGMDYKVAVDQQDLPPTQLKATLWAEMDHAKRTRRALAGGEALHPGFADNVYRDDGLSISWDNQPFQHGLATWKMPQTRPDAYARLIRSIDQSGRVYMAGDSVSYYSGWQEGAVRSAWWTLGLIRDHVTRQDAPR